MKKTLISCAVLALAGPASALVIDDFETDPFIGDAPITDVANGPRTLNATGGPLTVEINNGLNLGIYAHSQDSGATGESSASYSLGGADLAMDANAFRVELVSADLNGVVGVDVGGVSVTLTTNELLIQSGLVLPLFADFLFSDFAGVDFGSVDAVSLLVDGSNQEALDISLDNFGSVCTDASVSGLAGNISSTLCVREPDPDPDPVPVPAPLALLGLGLGAMMLRRRLT